MWSAAMPIEPPLDANPPSIGDPVLLQHRDGLQRIGLVIAINSWSPPDGYQLDVAVPIVGRDAGSEILPHSFDMSWRSVAAVHVTDRPSGVWRWRFVTRRP